jgi:hypothetical protein
MGGLLSKPITRKEWDVGRGRGLVFVAGSMQGWRPEMEDAHIAETFGVSPDSDGNEEAEASEGDGVNPNEESGKGDANDGNTAKRPSLKDKVGDKNDSKAVTAVLDLLEALQDAEKPGGKPKSETMMLTTTEEEEVESDGKNDTGNNDTGNSNGNSNPSNVNNRNNPRMAPLFSSSQLMRFSLKPYNKMMEEDLINRSQGINLEPTNPENSIANNPNNPEAAEAGAPVISPLNPHQLNVFSREVNQLIAIYGVYDGHGGVRVANYVKKFFIDAVF